MRFIKHVSILLFAVSIANCSFASGMYLPRSNFKAKESSDYSQGKALFFGKTKKTQGESCASCHSGDKRLKRSQLKDIKNSLADAISKNPEHRGTSKNLSSKDIEDISVYLKKRYQLR